MPTTNREELIAEGYAQGFPRGYALAKLMGKADVFAELLIRLLDHRGFALANELRERITSCTDEDLLLGWFKSYESAS